MTKMGEEIGLGENFLPDDDPVLLQGEIELYRDRIRRLQENVSSLRLSRRILMSLLAEARGNHQSNFEQLQRENRRLQRLCSSYANRLWEQNKTIQTLNQELVSQQEHY